MDVVAALVADGKTAEPGKPRQGPFHHPTIPAELLARLDTTPGDAGRDAATAQRLAAAVEVVRLVGMELGWLFAGPPPRFLDRSDGIDQFLQHARVVGVGR